MDHNLPRDGDVERDLRRALLPTQTQRTSWITDGDNSIFGLHIWHGSLEAGLVERALYITRTQVQPEGPGGEDKPGAFQICQRSRENSLIFQLILPFTSSAFVRPDSMSAGVRWFSEYQPFTPVIDTLRGLLLGTPIDNSAVLAVAWCVVLALVGYLWARAVYNRDSIQ